MHSPVNLIKPMVAHSVKHSMFRLLTGLAAGVALAALIGGITLAGAYLYIEPALPSVDAMRNVEFQVPLRIYTRDGQLIGQIGEQRRIPVTYDQIPDVVKHAFLAAEDDRFFQHHGIDFQGLARAAVVDVMSHGRTQGASTITQQAARNMFLTLDKTWRRKVQEAFLSYRMEDYFSKQEIFGLYLNVIFFGQRAYGVAAAADTFFGKPLDQLTVAEAATLAGLPQAPSRFNPVVNPQAAHARRSYVLRRMHELGYIDDATYTQANAEPVQTHPRAPMAALDAQYVAEMARQEVQRRFGAKALSQGISVYTTLDSRLQAAANRAVRLGLIEYDRRYGWRGALAHVKTGPATSVEAYEDTLDNYDAVGPLTPSVVVSVSGQSAQVYAKELGIQTIDWQGLAWARKPAGGGVGPAPKQAADVLAPGDVVYIFTDGTHTAQLVQIPEAQAALVAVDPTDGGVSALVGGFDFFSNKYNRAVQARRQPGSGFKPFLYSGALEAGFTAASVLPNSPLVLDGSDLESAWRPKNSHGFGGPTRLREALAESLNLVSIRLLRAVGIDYTSDYVTRFGFDKASLPHNLTLALGTLTISPLNLAGAYATFANGGFRVTPYYIDRIEDRNGKVLLQGTHPVACSDCEATVSLQDVPLNEATPATFAAADAIRGGPVDLPADQLAPRVISPQNDWIMTDMMADVIRHGTGRRAMTLGRSDLAGKTGTTDDARDAWFNGFNSRLEATVWVGYDGEKSLGESEEGARTALPIWIRFMREALKGVPQERRPLPDGLVTLRISPETGMLVSADNPDAMMETFMVNHLPTSEAATPGQTQPGTQSTNGDSLF